MHSDEGLQKPSCCRRSRQPAGCNWGLEYHQLINVIQRPLGSFQDLEAIQKGTIHSASTCLSMILFQGRRTADEAVFN
jgi:hypothetical protein